MHKNYPSAKIRKTAEARTPVLQTSVAFCLRKLLAELREDHREQFAAKGVRLEFGCPRGRLWVEGRRFDVKVALRHLLANALRHTPRNGCVALVAGVRDKGGVEVKVLDNGPGFPPLPWYKSLTAFPNQLSAYLSHFTERRGLYSAFLLLSANQVKLELNSKPGLGTRLRFVLRRTPRLEN